MFDSVLDVVLDSNKYLIQIRKYIEILTQSASTCSKLTTKTLEQGTRNMFKVNSKDSRTTPFASL